MSRLSSRDLFLSHCSVKRLRCPLLSHSQGGTGTGHGQVQCPIQREVGANNIIITVLSALQDGTRRHTVAGQPFYTHKVLPKFKVRTSLMSMLIRNIYVQIM